MYKGRFDYGKERLPTRLDAKDKQIVSMLLHNSRTALTSIAKKTRLSRDGVDYRVKRLEKEGIIKGYNVTIKYEALGYHVFHVFLLVEEKDQTERKRFIDFMKENESVIRLIEYTDRWDFETAIIAKTVIEFDEIIMNIVSEFPKLIIEKSKLETIRRFNIHNAPMLIGKEKIKIEKRIVQKEIRIDETDKQILKEISNNCRKAYYEIGTKIGVSSDTVRYRVKKMIADGIINEFTTMIELSRIGYQFYTFTMNLNLFDKKNEYKMESYIMDQNSIVGSMKMLGTWDLIIYIAVQNHREFHVIVKELKNLFSDTIKQYDTWVAYKEHFYKPIPSIITK